MTALLLDAATAALGLLVFGAHIFLPADAARAAKRAALWARLALPLGVAAVLLAYAGLFRHPDATLAAGLAPGAPRTPLAWGAALLVAAALLGDAVLLALWPRLEPAAWRLLAGLGGLGLAGWSLAAELLRAAGEPAGLGLALGAAARVLLACGAAQLVRRRPEGRWLTLGGLGAALHPAALDPGALRRLSTSGDLLTVAACAVLFLVAARLPAPSRRLAVAGALVLAALVLARALRASEVALGF